MVVSVDTQNMVWEQIGKTQAFATLLLNCSQWTGVHTDYRAVERYRILLDLFFIKSEVRFTAALN